VSETPSAEVSSLRQLVGADAPGAAVRSGIDRVELTEFERILKAGGTGFLGSVYTDAELACCRGRTERLAARFAAKEAATKMLGTGIRHLSLGEIEVVTSRDGQPCLELHGRARSQAERLGVSSLSVSLTHTSVAAEAIVVAIALPRSADPTSREETV
jgi:holo-[acyl-carrier protein] synthase